ncbi:hypothetical protein [Arachidicoccus soli]|uniref:Peptidoglycan-binding protein LysM n=1 Tax=Arachidicoccus soli TaxID=2341117 RepID=A0A386HS65_9BACT|nr:hypothetical protein [Arachidicoccus soli]AYD48705.1 hypothetical protein D6B99_14485 [Arachidicoccus soli]
MKKISFLIAIVIGLLLSTSLQAQTATGTVSLKLMPVQTIALNTTDINLTYSTATDYSAGKDSTNSNQLTCFSSSPFQITVQSTAVTANMPDVTLTPSSGTTALVGSPTYASALSVNSISTATPFITSTVGSNNATFNIEYKAPVIDVSTNTLHNSASGTTYTANLTYTIVPQ